MEPYVDPNAPKHEAASKIASFYKKKVMKRRERAYNQNEQGVLFSRKRSFNRKLNAIEIMSMFVIASPEDMCVCLRFTIFNYATK